MRMTYLRNGESLKLDATRCNGCGRCIEVCPHEVFLREDHAVRITDREACMECGACARNCETGALTVRAGVGCASAVISGILRGSQPSCGPSSGCSGPCCG